ncbi:hypothetical protein HELRODRAFT_169114 [Helobdella robusta]|uniref:Uncharacterized protein n=1 Tax=Helobdella robusta TaxID=6412 RepID=T1F1F0_HELRO|nr:hypothetical protein HELRODRAFT_169114 [Helobdella robusta]ESO08308.1 hypothetical protein HELRODRAFT_169114 [Helobdella robusta]
MFSQINITSMEDLESFHELILGVPLLLRVWVAFTRNDFVGESQPKFQFEKDMALLADTSHPMIRPQFEKAIDEARKSIQARRIFCVQIDFSEAIDAWLKTVYRRKYIKCCRLSAHKSILYITNYSKPETCFKCNPLWCLLCGPCWFLSAPCYKCYRKCKCHDVKVTIEAPIVRRTVASNTGRVIEVNR